MNAEERLGIPSLRKGADELAIAASDHRRRVAGRGRRVELCAPQPMPEVRFADDDGRRVLLVDGAVQSVTGAAVDGYWAEMIPSHRPARALLLGLGAGTVARLLHARFGSVPIVAVDDDPAVIALARGELADLTDLEIVEADAFQYVQRSTDRFELACVDLYRGAQLQAGIVARPFLRALRALLLPRGLAVFNLVADRRVETRITRIARVYRILERARDGKNLVVWCR